MGQVAVFDADRVCEPVGQVTVVKCQDCPTVCIDMDAMRVHKLIHLDITYLRCSAPPLLPAPLQLHLLHLGRFISCTSYTCTSCRCTSCPLVFGSPSSLTRHSFLSHGLVLQPSELQPDMVSTHLSPVT